MKWPLLIFALLLAIPSYADDRRQPTPPALHILISDCLPVIAAGGSAAALATRMELPEFAPEQAIKFSPSGGRVFAVPDDMGNAVFITNPEFESVCGVAVRKGDAAQYWDAIDKKMGPGTPFRLIRETREDDKKQTRRDYRADIGASPLVVFITIADAPREDGMQMLLTAARVKKDDHAK